MITTTIAVVILVNNTWKTFDFEPKSEHARLTLVEFLYKAVTLLDYIRRGNRWRPATHKHDDGALSMSNLYCWVLLTVPESNGSAIVDTKLLPLTQRTLHTAIFAFKCIHEMVPRPFNNYSKVIQPKYSTRNSKFKLMVPYIFSKMKNALIEQ